MMEKVTLSKSYSQPLAVRDIVLSMTDGLQVEEVDSFGLEMLK